MRHLFYALVACFSMINYGVAAPQLPGKCTAAQPQVLTKRTLKESEIRSFLSSGTWGQGAKSDKYWTVYSDRSHNVTYNTPSTSGGKCDELGFNEKVRIAKIEGDFALVYKEPREGVQNFVISTEAVSKGWIPMKNLLLWESCPTDEAGIYNKALIVLNIDDNNNADLGMRYKNPETRDEPTKPEAGMDFYFVMKKGENGLVLLSKECSMKGYSDNVLYGWVSTNTFVPWSQRTCLEPNWKPYVAEELKGEYVNVYKDGVVATKLMLGRENGITSNSTTKYRLEPELLRYPLLENKTGNQDQYCITAFARTLGGESNIPRVPIGRSNSTTSAREKVLEGLSVINLIVVIDGTKSMEKYYQPTQQIIQKAYEFFGKEDKTVKVGVVIYRDYTDGEYVTEHLSMRSPTDPSVGEFLRKGGIYGVKSSPADRTLAEALYKGLEVALDKQKMGYSSTNSNLMFVIGDCGNDLNDNKCLSKEEIVRKCIENKVQISAFQVRNENELSFLLFRKQMGEIVRENTRAQYAALGNEAKGKGGFKELADGYDFQSGLDADQNFFIGATRNAPLGKEMDINKLYNLVKDSYLQFNAAIKAQGTVVFNAADSFREAEGGNINTRLAINLGLLKQKFTQEQINAFKANNTMMALQGYTDKVDSKRNLEYWQPIIYISSDEFTQLIEKLKPVMTAAGTNNRKPFVDAMKELTRSMIPDITQTEMDSKDVKEIMALVAGLNVKTGTLGGRTLAEIQSEEKVSQDEFESMIANFQTKYNKLDRIHQMKYEFSYKSNNKTWYWIPVEDLP